MMCVCVCAKSFSLLASSFVRKAVETYRNGPSTPDLLR